MKKLSIVSAITFLFLMQITTAQPTIKATILKKNGKFKVNDMVELVGYKKATESTSAQYMIKDEGKIKYLPFASVRPIDPTIDQWEELWFFNSSYNAIQNNWDISLRNELKSDFDSYVNDLLEYKLLFKDELLDDYFTQLINKICPHPIFKGKDYFLKVLVIKASEQEILSFDNGMIIISTGLLSHVKSEQELVYLLSREVANVILDFNLVNLKQQIKSAKTIRFWTGLADVTTHVAADISQYKNRDTDKIGFTHDDADLLTLSACLFSAVIMQQMGTKVTDTQLQLANYSAQRYMNNKYPGWPKGTPDDFTRIVSNVLTYTAWQSFYKVEYSEVKTLLNRLENAHLLTEDGYLLKAKMYRSLYSTDESIYEALNCLKNAENLGMSELVDVYKEYGILYLRLKDNTKAIEYFEKYRDALQKMQQNEQNAEELRWVIDTISRYKS